jgi:hypothetical protein
MTKISVKEWRSAKTAIFLLGVIVAVSSCKKPEEELGLSVQPAGDVLAINIVDTTSITASTTLVDSLQTDARSSHLLGSYNDPVFGTTSASIAMQFAPTGQPQAGDFGDLNLLVVDSVVLALAYTGEFYTLLGDPQTFRVHRMTDELEVDTAYYSNEVINHDNVDMIVGGAGVQVMSPDSVTVVGGDTLATNQLRLRIDNTFGYDLFAENELGTLADATGDLFNSWLKGLYITPDNPGQLPGEGAVCNFDLLSTFTTLTVYYRDTTPAAEDTTSYSLIVGDFSERVTIFEHDYTGTVVEAQINNPAAGQQELYAQSGAGTRVKMEFPHIMNYNDSGAAPIAVNKAVLVVRIDEDQITDFYPADRMFVIGINEAGEEFIVLDQFEGDDHIDGYFDATNSEYRINLTRHFQSIWNGETFNGELYLFPGNSSVSVNRVVLYGPENPEKSLNLELTYTQY